MNRGSVLFLLFCFHAVKFKRLESTYLNDLNDNQNLDAIFKISYSLHNGVKHLFEFEFAFAFLFTVAAHLRALALS